MLSINFFLRLHHTVIALDAIFTLSLKFIDSRDRSFDFNGFSWTENQSKIKPQLSPNSTVLQAAVKISTNRVVRITSLARHCIFAKIKKW